MFESRKNFYEECAKMTIDTTNRSPEEIINEILQQLKGRETMKVGYLGPIGSFTYSATLAAFLMLR